MIHVVATRGKKRRDFKAYAQQVTLGRDPSCEVHLSEAEELEPRHLLLVPGPEGVWVAVVEAARVPARLAGRPFTRGMVTFGAALEIGELSLSFHDRAPQRPSQGKAFLALAAVVVPVFVVSRLLGPGHRAPKTAEPEAVTLFDEPGACAGPNATAAAAEELAERAAAKKDRFGFSVVDGIEAVQLYGAAEACYGALGEAEPARAARASRLALRTRIEDDYRVLRARLAWAREQHRMETAYDAAQLLLVYVGHRDGPYRQWLVQLASRLQPLAERERERTKKEQKEREKKKRRLL